MDGLRTSFISHIHGPMILLFILVIVAIAFAFRDNNQDGEHQKVGDLTVGGVIHGGRRQVIVVTGTETCVTAAQSGALFDLRVRNDVAATITLPKITADNLGMEYTFHVGTANGTGYKIITGDTTDTTGDVYSGHLMLIYAAGTSAQSQRVTADASNDSQILLDATATNGGGNQGSFVNCVAIEDGTSPAAADASGATSRKHIWLVSGTVNMASHNNGSGIFSNI